MGRFYKTAKPTFVDDAMYQAPHELMLNALQTQDDLLNDQKAELDEFDTMGDLLDFVDKDKGARTAALEGHRQKALELTEKINENPALYSSYIGEINRAKRAFNEDIKTGSLFEMDRAAQRRTGLIDKINKRTDISETARNEAILKIDRDYQGVGKGDFAEDIHIYEEMDEGQFQKDLKTTVAVNGKGTTTKKPDGKGYFVQNGETKTYITEERLRGIVTSDPAVKDWRNEQLQTLERQLERKEIPDRETMEKIYSDRYDDFVNNTIEKLAFEKIQTDDNVMSVDTKVGADKNRWQAARHFEQSRRDRAENNYFTEINAVVDDISDADVDALFTPSFSTSSTMGPLTLDGKGLDWIKKMTSAEKRDYLNTERQSLITKLSEKGDPSMDVFRDRMKSVEGRKQLIEETGLTYAELSRQANYNKSYNLTTPTVPDYNDKDVDKVKEQKAYLKTTQKGLNQVFTSVPYRFDVISPDGTRTRQTMTIAEATKDGVLRAPTMEKTVAGDPQVDPEGNFIDLEGNPLVYTKKNKDGSVIESTKRPLTMKEINARGTTYKVGKSKKVSVPDPSKPVLNVSEEEIFDTTETVYDLDRRPIETPYYTVVKNVLAPDGKSTNMVIVYIPKSDVDVHRQKGGTGKTTTTTSSSSSRYSLSSPGIPFQQNIKNK